MITEESIFRENKRENIKSYDEPFEYLKLPARQLMPTLGGPLSVHTSC